MESLRQKARVLSLAWLHQVADAAVDMNSIPVVQQYIRDLEQAMADLREAQAQNAGGIAGLNRQIAQLHQQEATLNTQADSLLQRLQEVENNLTPLENQLEKAQAIQAQYEQVMDSLEAKHASMVRQLRTLQSLTTSASAEERAAQAIHAAGNALGDNSSIDNITQRIQSRSDVAHARLQQAMGSVTPQPDPVADALEQSAMQQRIATRRARLGLPSAGGTTVNEVPNQ